MECKSKGKTSRTGLYIIVLLIFMRACDTNERVKKIEEYLAIHPKVEKQIETEKDSLSFWETLGNFFLISVKKDSTENISDE